MKTLQISKVHYEMLVALAKKARMKPEAYIEENIQMNFNKK
tara:strand:- start:438 stop:560 length:123 start_codon:yes stop_codon:yes gene_type:complete